MPASPFLFYDSQNHDRQYNSESFEILLRSLFSSGVRWGAGGALKVTAAGGMYVSVDTGFAMINGKCCYFDTAQSDLRIDTNTSGTVRRDLVIVQRDDTNRQIVRKIKKGSGSAAPQLDEATEILLATVTVPSGASTITDGDITDERSYMTEAVQEIDFSAFQAQFEAWMDNLNDDLDPESAAGLITDVATLKTDFPLVSSNAEAALTAANSAVDAVEDMKLAGGTKVQKIWELTETGTGVTYMVPQLLIAHTPTPDGEVTYLRDLTQYQMLLVVAETRCASDAPTKQNVSHDKVYALLFPDSETELTCWTPRTAKGATKMNARRLRWSMTGDTIVTYSASAPSGSKISGVATVPSETFAPGLVLYWADGWYKNTTYSIGDRYEKFESDGQTWTVPKPADYITQDSKNRTANTKANYLLVPVAVYGISNINTVISE